MSNMPIGNLASTYIAKTVAEFTVAVAIISDAPVPGDLLAGSEKFVEKYLAAALSAPSADDFLGSPETVTYEQLAAYARAVCEHSLSVLGGVK